MYTWTERSVLWYADAVAYTGFDRLLADALAPYLPPEETVCDLGCGTGYLALELARRGYAVTAIDQDPAAMDWLRKQREVQGLAGLRALEQNWDDLAPEQAWDNIVMVNAGRHGYPTAFYRRRCRNRLLVVDRASLGSHVRGGAHSARRLSLKEERPEEGPEIPLATFTMEFGQPLRSLEEARAYIAHQGGDPADPRALAELQETGETEFPYYLPYRKALRLFVFEGMADR